MMTRPTERAMVALYLNNAIAQENNRAYLYCPSCNYQHLLVCCYGQVSTQINNKEISINTNNDIFRVTIPGSPPVAISITGLSSTAHRALEGVNSWPSGNPTSVAATVVEIEVEAEFEVETKETVEATRDSAEAI